MDKLKSRKFWFAIIAALIPIVNENFGLRIPTESIIGLIAFILGEGVVDAARAYGGTF